MRNESAPQQQSGNSILLYNKFGYNGRSTAFLYRRTDLQEVEVVFPHHRKSSLKHHSRQVSSSLGDFLIWVDLTLSNLEPLI
jgi:hypothetical protein